MGGAPRLAILAVALLVAGGGVAVLIARPHRTEPLRPDNAAGDATCLSCHAEQAGFEQTAHHLTSRLPSRQAIAGSFTPGSNVLRTSNPLLHFRMDSTATGFYQTAVQGRAPDTSSRTEQIAFVTGSRKGQSYLYWRRGDQLFQLPVSYWEGIGWVNSPGYPDGRPNFDRPIPPRCLECHASWFESVPDPRVPNRYRSSGMILGISCETCHGSGRAHVRRERSWLHSLLPSEILNPRRVPRERQIDACALCHSGATPLRTAAFSHVPGQPLEKTFSLWSRSDSGEIDVHGNQVALLQRSRCFRFSQMTCATCHDVHSEQRDVAMMAARCVTCHTPQSCGLFSRYGASLVGRCVDCHMPLQTSAAVFAAYQGHEARVQVRSHLIKVYPEMDTLPHGSY